MQWRSIALAGALVAATGVGSASTQAQSPRAVELLSGPARPSAIGVTVHDPDASDIKGSAPGVVIDDVSEESPAEKAGIKSGDRIVEFDGERVRSARQFARVVQETVPGRAVPVVLTRAGEPLTVTVTPEAGSDFSFRLLNAPEVWRGPALPARPPRPSLAPPAPPVPFSLDLFGRSSRLGATVESLNEQLADYFGAKQGVLVKSVADGSSAAKIGLKAGDVITAINGDHVDDPSDVARELQRLERSAALSIDIVRDRTPQTLKGKLENGSSTRYRANR